ncbi:hypothetical protein BC829DRAFT_422380 [Chytridium lagenaria]|nr:hypothetical protein BC829DRAFT_422380 [Chytridium lagenaria]
MYSANLETLRDRPYTKWEKYMQKSLQAAITEYTLMDPYGDVTIQDGEGMDRDIPADINISGSDQIGYGPNEYDNQFYTEEYRRKVLIDYKESILNQKTTAAPRPNNVFILQDYSANPKVNQLLIFGRKLNSFRFKYIIWGWNWSEPNATALVEYRLVYIKTLSPLLRITLNIRKRYQTSCTLTAKYLSAPLLVYS